METEEEKPKRDMINCVGQFTLNIKKGEVFNNEYQLKELKAIMASIIVVRATHLTTFDQIHYVALSDHFREIGEGENVPCYMPSFNLNVEGEIVNIEWSEEKNENLS